MFCENFVMGDRARMAAATMLSVQIFSHEDLDDSIHHNIPQAHWLIDITDRTSVNRWNAGDDDFE